jgi:hypothetical protein
MMRVMRSLSLAAAMAGSLCGSAQADQMSDVAEQVCIPEAGYFAVRWYRVDDIDIEGVNHLHNLDRFSFVWSGTTLECRLRGHIVRVSSVPAAIRPKQVKQPCQTSFGKSFEISWDGKRLACVDDSYSGNERRQSVSITLNGVSPSSAAKALLEQCIATLEPASGAATTIAEEGRLRCETRFFDPASGKLKA